MVRAHRGFSRASQPGYDSATPYVATTETSGHRKIVYLARWAEGRIVENSAENMHVKKIASPTVPRCTKADGLLLIQQHTPSANIAVRGA